jgi:hypothetical protein
MSSSTPGFRRPRLARGSSTTAAFLGIDVTPVISTLPEPERRQLADLGQAALGAFEKGLVHLVQERVGPDRFAYIAVARPRPKAANASLSALLLEERAA